MSALGLPLVITSAFLDDAPCWGNLRAIDERAPDAVQGTISDYIRWSMRLFYAGVDNLLWYNIHDPSGIRFHYGKPCNKVDVRVENHSCNISDGGYLTPL
jgi:hypothetical protein